MILRFVWLAAIGLCVAAHGQGNLLINPGFERASGAFADGWTGKPPADVVLREDGGHRGRRYMRLTDPDESTGVMLESSPLPCRPSGRYRASAWFRSPQCRPGIYLNFYDEAGTRIHHLFEQFAEPPKDWTQQQVETSAPIEALTVTAILYSYGADVGMVDVDDVMMTVTGGTAPGSAGIPPAPVGKKEGVKLESRRELFVDGYMVDSLSGTAVRRMHTPQVRQPVLTFVQPWEGVTSAYYAVMAAEDGVRIYYRGSGEENAHEVTCVAVSPDGINFTKPNLGLFEWEGSKDNNIVWVENATHNFTPFLDTNPAAPADQRYKALASSGPQSELGVFVSPDGYHWRMLREEPVITKGAFDSQNLAFWDPLRKLYVEYHRGFQNNVRDIMTSTSEDFIHWTEPAYLDYGEAPPEHLYTNAITPYFRAPHLYLGFPNRFMEERTKIANHPGGTGVNDALLMSSRDMLQWERWEEAFIRPTLDPQNWTDRNNYVAWGIVPLNEREIGIYSTDHYRHPTIRLMLNTIRTDGFASIYADMKGGQLLTRPFTFTGKQLEVNYATSAAGSLRFELCDEEGKAFPGFALTDSETLFGNELAHIVSWQGGSDVSSLAGRTVRLRVSLRDADLFSLRFGE